MKEFTVSATIILISKDKRALILQRNPTDSFPNQWTVPGGKLEEGDFVFGEGKDFCYYPSEYGALREVKEETGIEIKFEDLRFLCSLYLKDINRFIISLYAVLDKNAEEMEVTLSDNQAYRWIRKEDIEKYEFIPDIGMEVGSVFEVIKYRN